MQRKITITSLNFNGDVALKKHMEEFNKIGFKNRLIFKTAGYKQEVIQEEPFILVLYANNRHCANPVFLDLIRGEIEKALKENGAIKDTDYKLEVS